MEEFIEIEVTSEEVISKQIIGFFTKEFNLQKKEVEMLQNTKVCTVKGLGPRKGAYDKRNKMVYLNYHFVSKSPKIHFENLIHELTHVIQDFKNTLVPYSQAVWNMNPSEIEAVDTTAKYFRNVLGEEYLTWDERRAAMPWMN